MSDIEIDNTDPYQFGKPRDRKEIDDKRGAYLASGGMIHKIIPPYGTTPIVVECDVFVPGEGSHPSAAGLKDTKVRKPRPEKKFGKK